MSGRWGHQKDGGAAGSSPSADRALYWFGRHGKPITAADRRPRGDGRWSGRRHALRDRRGRCRGGRAAGRMRPLPAIRTLSAFICSRLAQNWSVAASFPGSGCP